MRMLRVICGVALLTVCFAPASHADEWTKLTYFTFSAPVDMPGVTLPAGTYRFELADPESGRRVVRVSDKDGLKVRGTFLSIANQKLEPASKPLVMFKEAPAGAPEAIKAWWYPGETYGYEFVYPHDQAMKIAKASHESVLSTNGTAKANTSTSDIARVDENASADEKLKDSSSRTSTTTAKPTTSPESTTADRLAAAQPRATTAAPTTAPKTARPATTTASATTTAPATAGSRTTTRAAGTSGTLPRTASQLPLFALLSALSLAGACALRVARTKA
jgi:hypothetical protein